MKGRALAAQIDRSLGAALVFCVLAAMFALLLAIFVDVSPLVAWSIVVVWVGGCALGIIDTFATLRDAKAERRGAEGDVVLVDIANANVRRELFRILELGAFLLVGINALRSTPADPSPTLVFGRTMILYIVILLNLNARLDRHERRNTDHLIRQGRLHQRSVE